MSEEDQSIGMMEGAFFVPKGDLINWVNSTLGLEISRIQQLGTGAVYCNIIDAMYPGKVAMQRVNWKARNQWQFLCNFKILQQAFLKCKIHKHIEIQKLVKCKYQDNLQFIQWLKRYYDLHNKNDTSSYDAQLARKNSQVDFGFINIRNPLKKQNQKSSAKNIRKSKSPYDNVKPKVNNRSVTLEKPRHQDNYFKSKISQIRQVLKKGGKEDQKLEKIQQIIQQLEEETKRQKPRIHTEQQQVEKIEKTESKKLIEIPKKQKTKLVKK